MRSPALQVLGSADPSRPEQRDWARGAYLTDGKRLLRVVSPLAPPAGKHHAELEDCLTLEVQSYSADELWDMWLRPVPRAAA